MTVVAEVAGENLFSAPTEHRHRRNKLRLTVIRPRQHEQRMAISLDEACQTFAGKLSAAQVSGDKEKAQKIYSQGSKRIASKFNGATCPNVKAP